MKILKQAFGSLLQSVLTLNNPYYFFGLPKADYVIRGSQISLKKLGLEFSRGQFESVIESYPFAIKIAEHLGGKFSIAENELFLKVDGLIFRINSAEEIFILFEVFVCGVYRYMCTRDSVFIDIGMNSAATTLFYAREPLVTQVYSFELFRPTFQLATTNLELNPRYAAKVEANCYGLSDKATEATLDYSPAKKGRMGLKGLPQNERFPDIRKESVVVKDVLPEFERIINAAGKKDIIVKIDCEGEEYAIVARLWQTGLLSKLTVLMIEWHYTSPAVLVGQLQESGFHIFFQTLPSLDSGMIYACRQSK
ncbi:MAG TPA: FkbM family methyltransferase [Cyclobacteriaceae bacterium]|nr:FkbM family methyltransferase [Cyclobacteriaceae bacterium]